MQALFEELSNGQNPETLFITCADSRIVPSLITQASPGELFVTRNIGNIIPPYSSSFLSSEAAAIEYSINTFGIKDIIVCGHSQCGAMKGLLDPDLEKTLPHVASWLTHSHTARRSSLMHTTKENIKLQLEHLKTYPVILEKLNRNELHLHGWYYELESGKIAVYEASSNEFIDIERALQLAIEARKNKIINHIVLDYLEEKNKSQFMDEYYYDFTPIWHDIKMAVQQKLWTELGGFYENEQDDAFVSLVMSGAQFKLENLNRMQINIHESQEYQEPCRSLKNISIFCENGNLCQGSEKNISHSLCMSSKKDGCS